MLFDQANVPGWKTTAPDGKIEIWGKGAQGVTAPDGNQLAELNANVVASLYQDVATTPGQVVKWSLQHRGRYGTDTMRVRVGSTTVQTQQGPNITDGDTAWGTYSGFYTVPAGQTTTRFLFDSVSASGGSPSAGNLLDDIKFGNSPCLTADKSVTNISGNSPVRVGDTLEYKVDVINSGGSDAPLSVLTDQIPTGATYVPGSLKITAGTGIGNLTDAAGDDRGEYNASQDQVTVRLGTAATASAGGILAPRRESDYHFPSHCQR